MGNHHYDYHYQLCLFLYRAAKVKEGRAINRGSINGEKITEDEYIHVYEEVMLQYFFNNGGTWLSDAERSSFEPERQTYFRILIVPQTGGFGE